jgi:hypothetical protein
MQQAQQYKKVGETRMNKNSSRSHCIFTMRIQAKRTMMDGTVIDISGKLHMVDLAGSECAKTAGLDKVGGVSTDFRHLDIFYIFMFGSLFLFSPSRQQEKGNG